MKFQFLPWRLGCGFLCPFVLCVLGPCSDQELSILEKNPYLSPLGFQMILCADAEFGNFYKTKYCKGKKKKKSFSPFLKPPVNCNETILNGLC